MGTAFPGADPSISGQLPGSRIIGRVGTGPHLSGFGVYQESADGHKPKGGSVLSQSGKLRSIWPRLLS